jgi:putative tricarboxylic transport membrane protein
LKKKIQKVVSPIFILFLVLALAACGAQRSDKSTEVVSKGIGSAKKADDYPNKAINLVVPFTAGSPGDVFSRTFGKIAEKYLGQTLVIVNKEGGSGAIGVTHMLSQPADGYTIVYHSSTFAYTMAAGQVSFKTNDILPIATINADYQTVGVKKDSPFKTFDELVKFAKANPGKLKFSGSTVKGTNHVLALKIFKEAGIQASYIPYDGGNKSVLALLGGNVDALVGSSSVVNAQVDSGDLRLLAVSSGERVPNRKDVPTLKELGLTKIVDENIWRGFFGKPGIPKERLNKLESAFEQVVKDPAWQEYQKKENQIDFYKNSADFTKYFEQFMKDGEEVFKGLPN